MDVGHVHEVVLESGVVVVSETTWSDVADGNVDMGNGQASSVELERLAYSGWSAEYAGGGDCRCCAHLEMGVWDGNPGNELLAVIFQH